MRKTKLSFYLKFTYIMLCLFIIFFIVFIINSYSNNKSENNSMKKENFTNCRNIRTTITHPRIALTSNQNPCNQIILHKVDLNYCPPSSSSSSSGGECINKNILNSRGPYRFEIPKEKKKWESYLYYLKTFPSKIISTISNSPTYSPNGNNNIIGTKNMSDGTITNCGLEFNFPLNTMDYSPAPSMEDLRDEISECNLKYTLMKV